RAEVEDYLTRAADRLPEALEDLRAHHARPVTFVVRNNTERNYTKVDIELHIDGEVHGYGRPLDEPRTPREVVGDPPRRWGPWSEPAFALRALTNSPRIDFSSSLHLPRAPGSNIRDDGSGTIDFPVFDLRPGGRHLLPGVALVAERRFA